MPVKVRDLQRVAKRLGFEMVRQKGSHSRWVHPDGRTTTIPIHGNKEIGSWLFREILSQMQISEEEFNECLNQ